MCQFDLLTGGLEEQTLFRLIRNELNSMPCQNHGFVLDGFPKTYSEAKEFFYGTLPLLNSSGSANILS